ncbi:hypothetical protein [Candidatus Nitrosocosmicus hydrocola]|uniref:hypothetical protein n=1 Tax=Candidatus Nitrosocosmicus hydrocola TaxID=1826872 RepID=UPI000A7D7FA5|nr:hypothetical protein [Candidatus Nitrosocosmicus hydrocola]
MVSINAEVLKNHDDIWKYRDELDRGTDFDQCRIEHHPCNPHTNQIGVEVEVDSIDFTIGGHAKWTIQRDAFSQINAGRLKLKKEERANGDYEIKLIDALFPGTNLRADFRCFVAAPPSGGGGRLMKIYFSLFHNSEWEIVCEDWLNNKTHLTREVRFTENKLICSFGDSWVKLENIEEDDDSEEDYDNIWTFFPNWMLKLETTAPILIKVKVNYEHDDVNILGREQTVTATMMELLLLLKDKPSLSITPFQKRSLIVIHRENNDWSEKKIVPRNLVFPVDSMNRDSLVEIARIDTYKDSFDKMFIELGHNEGDNSKLQMLLVQSQDKRDNKIVFNPQIHSSIPSEDLTFAEIQAHLFETSFVIDYSNEESHLISKLTPDESWLFINDHSFQISKGGNEHSIKVSSYKKKICMSCELFFDSFVVPLDDNISIRPTFSDFDNLPIKDAVYNPKNYVANKLEVLAKTSDDLTCTHVSAAVNTGIHLSFPLGSLHLFRHTDLLSLNYEFLNFTLSFKIGYVARLLRTDTSEESLIKVIVLSPQHIAEQTYHTDPNPQEPPSKSFATYPSRLVFRLPVGEESMDFTTESLFKWEKLELVLQDIPPANLRKSIKIREIQEKSNIPEDWQTSIESPWRIIVSPNADSGWNHTVEFDHESKYHELWHTRLGIKKLDNDNEYYVDEDDERNNITAIYTYDRDSNVDSLFTTSLDRRDRETIVNLSTRKPVSLKKFYLSSLGAWMDVFGDWEVPLTDRRVGKQQWFHRATMGRDSYVQVTSVGYFCPLGFAGQMTKIVKRVFSEDPNDTICYLEEDYIVEFLDKNIQYDYKGRDFLFKSISLAGESAFLIDPPPTVPYPTDPDPGTDHEGYDLFYPKLDKNLLLFPFIGLDSNNNKIRFDMPLLFIELDALEPANHQSQIERGYKKYQADNRTKYRKVNMKGQLISYSKGPGGDNTIFPTTSMTFYSIPNTDLLNDHIPFQPVLDTVTGTGEIAEIAIPQIEKFTGHSTLELCGSKSIPIKFHKKYLDEGFGTSGVFIEIPEGKHIKFAFSKGSSYKSGGLITPDLSVSGLSKEFGLVNGNIDTFADSRFDPAQYFDSKSKLLGFFDLSKMIEPIGMDVKDKIPKLITVETPTSITTTYSWIPEIGDMYEELGIGIEFLGIVVQNRERLKITSNIVTKIKGGSSDVTITGLMHNFNINLFDLIKVGIDQLKFENSTGKKMKVAVKLRSVGEPLEFQNELRIMNTFNDRLKDLNLDKGPDINITNKGVQIGYRLPVPNIQLGAFSIFNLLIKSSLELPFTSDPLRFIFSIGERESPFGVLVSIYGGEGYFGITVGRKGIEIMEGYIGFLGCSSMDFNGIAHGSIGLKAGMYIRVDKSGPSPKTVYEGSIQAWGCVRVLNLASVSIDMVMWLQYIVSKPQEDPTIPREPDIIFGVASVTVSFKVLFVTKSRTLEMTRKYYVNSPRSDEIVESEKLNFENMMPLNDWLLYRQSFSNGGVT